MAQPKDINQQKPLKERRDTTVGILRVDTSKKRRSSVTSLFSSIVLTPPLEPNSPQPSVDRLSVTFAPDNLSQHQEMEKVHFTRDSKTSADGDDGDEDAEEEEEDYSASVSAILLRRASSKRQTSRRRRPSSTFSPDGLEALPRRRSSNVTTTSAETAISIDEGLTEEHIFQNIKLHKEVLSNVKQQPWPMRRKMKLVKQAKTYVKIHEGELQERLAQSKTTKDMLACCDIIFVKEWQFVKRELANLMNVMVPWELRIKEIESHFGSVVASYFTFLRWLFWVNLVISLILITFVAIPEVLTADRKNAGERKEILEDERANATNFMTLWDFEGVLKYSPIFYGYYTSQEKSRRGFSYKGPLAYFLTGLAVYIYSFVATLRRMAENSRQSKLSEKDDECVFTWKLFTGWDYMIGNSETAHNRTASIILGFKEALLEEAEKKRDERSWKMLALRIFTNLNVLWLFASSVYAVVLVVERSTKQREAGGWWRQNEVTIVVSLITNVFPFIFEMLGSLEQYHPRKRLRMQLARIMVLNMLNLYTFILASFSKISDMTLRLQEIKQLLINNTSSKPAELLAGKHETFAPTLTTISGNILYNILNTTQTTISPCYVKKVNCSTKMTTDQSLPSTTASSLPSTSTQSPSTVSTLTTLFLLSSTLSTLSPDIERNESLFDINNDTYNFINNFDNKSMSSLMLDRIYDYNSIYDKKFHNTSYKNSKDVNVTKHYIVPFVLQLFNYDKMEDESNYDKNYNETEEDFLTPEDYPDNDTDTYINFDITDDVNLTTLNDIYNYTESTTMYTDDGCQYITICPDTSSSEPSTLSSHPTETMYSETTEFKTSPSTFTVVTDETPVDHSLQTKNLDIETRRKLRSLCWETMFGQELVKLTVMDLVLTIMSTLMVDFFRAVFVRVMNNCWCWDLEKKFPQYGDFKIAENILHLVNNQGMVWMGMFFSPGLPLINLIKLVVMMYLRSWTVLTCNVPHEVVFRASRSNNFYLALLLTMLFLCVLPVSYAIVWVEPSWHCGPFSNYEKIYHLFTNSTKKALPSKVIHRALDYIASPGIVIPLLMLLVLIIYYLISLTNALREANNDLKIQLRRERTEERRKVFQMVDRKHRGGGSGDLIDSTPFHKWQKTLNVLPNSKLSGDQISDTIKEDNGHNINGDIKSDAKKLLSKLTKHSVHKHSDEERIPIMDADGTDVEQVESLPDDRVIHTHLHKHKSHINKSTVPAEVHKTETHIKKHHETVTIVHHKHEKKYKQDEHDKHLIHEKQENHKHDKHSKMEKHEHKEKHDKHHISDNKDMKKYKDVSKQERKGSSTSLRSDVIPEILISQTDSADESPEETKYDQPSKSSSADTIIATDTADQWDNDFTENKKNKNKKKISYKITKPISEDDMHPESKEKHKKHHKSEKLEHKDELSKKHSTLVESRHFLDKEELQKEETPSVHKRKKDDKHTTVHSIKDKPITVDKTSSKGKSKDHITKDEKSDESTIKKHHREDVLLPHKDKKVEGEHKEKEHKKDSHDTSKKHDLHEDNEKIKKHHHTYNDAIESGRKSSKSRQKGRIEILHKSDESEGEEHKLLKKKKHISEDKKQQHFTSESSSKEEIPFKLKSKHKLHVDSSSHILSTNSTDESIKSSKKHRTDKKIEGVTTEKLTEGKDLHKHTPHKNEEKDNVIKQKDSHKIHKEKHKEKFDNENKSIEKYKSGSVDKDHKHLKHKKKDVEHVIESKVSELTDHKTSGEKGLLQKKSKEVKEILPQTSSENDLTEYDEPDITTKLERNKKIKKSRKLSSDQSLSDQDYKKVVPGSKSKENYYSDDDDNNVTDNEDDRTKTNSDDNDLSRSINEDSQNDTGSSKSQEIKKKKIKQKSPVKPKKVILVETDSKQSSSDSQSSRSQQSNSQNVNYDDNEDYDIENADVDDSSKELSNESIKEKSI